MASAVSHNGLYYTNGIVNSDSTPTERVEDVG